MKTEKEFRIVTKTLGGRKVKVPTETISHEEFGKRVTEIMKKAIEREKKA